MIHMGDPYALAYVQSFPVSHDYNTHAGPSPFNAMFKIPEVHHHGLFKSVIWLTKGDILQLNHFEPRGRLQVINVTLFLLISRFFCCGGQLLTKSIFVDYSEH
mmetsp:Transcript_51983/g.108588  ORF Transcript_51983/g.108588 Transcript_51983/m.108588 type:complete len:103 (-) Transcript_51983:1231-1539(-)